MLRFSYTNKDSIRQKLTYAIRNCVAIDGDSTSAGMRYLCVCIYIIYEFEREFKRRFSTILLLNCTAIVYNLEPPRWTLRMITRLGES